jgi:hypothetical protein
MGEWMTRITSAYKSTITSKRRPAPRLAIISMLALGAWALLIFSGWFMWILIG